MKYPKENEPTIAPRQFIDPIQDNSSFVSGADNGVVSDAKMGNAGDTLENVWN